MSYCVERHRFEPKYRAGRKRQSGPIPDSAAQHAWANIHSFTSGQRSNEHRKRHGGLDVVRGQGDRDQSAEIQLGQLASRKAQNDRVKSFGQMMVKDHTDGLSKLQRLQDSARTITSTPSNQPPNTSNQPPNTQNRDTNPTTGNKSTGDTASPSTSSSSIPPLSAEHRQLMTRLEGMSGAQFDREYINAMVNGHREAVKFFEQEAGSTSNTSTTARTETENRSSAPAGARDTTGGTTEVADFIDGMAEPEFGNTLRECSNL